MESIEDSIRQKIEETMSYFRNGSASLDDVVGWLTAEVSSMVAAAPLLQNNSNTNYFDGRLDKLMEGIQIISLDWRYIYVNDTLVSQSYYSKEQLLGHTMMEMYPGIENSSLFKALEKCMADQLPLHMENEFTYPDNTSAWFELSIQPVPEGIFVLSVDITKRKTGEEKLKASEFEYRSLIDQASDAILISDGKGNYIDVNPSACELLGYSKQEFLHLNVKDVLSEDEMEKQPLRFQELNSGKTILSVRTLKRKDGSLVPVEINAKKLTGERYMGITRNITERKKTEDEVHRLHDELEQKVKDRTAELENKIRQLKETEQKFEKAFQASSGGITITRLSDGVYIDVNDAFVDMTGYRRDELINHSSSSLGLVVDIEKRESILMQIRSDGFARDFEMVVRCKSGELINVLASVETIVLNGENFGLNIIYDITERKKAADKLEFANKELESFSYSVSHDLRSPLRSILGFAGILEEDYSAIMDEEGKRTIAMIQGSAIRMNNLIDDLLEFSKAGKREMRRTETDNLEIVKRIVSEMDPEQLSRVTVTYHFLPTIRADYALINQVWVNLISNAFKYSAKREQPRIDIGAVKIAHAVVFYVKDNGAGFDMQYVERLFGIFQRLHSESEFAGTGVGLALVKRIIARHGGKVWAESELDVGAAFYFSLPSE